MTEPMTQQEENMTEALDRMPPPASDAIKAVGEWIRKGDMMPVTEWLADLLVEREDRDEFLENLRIEMFAVS